VKISSKLALSTAALALAAAPALAHSGPPADPGSQGKNHANNHSQNSHKCTVHKVAYVASGTLVSQTLTKNADGTYTGDVTVNVTKTNRHARADKGTTKTYTVSNAHVSFGLADTNNDGSVGLDDLAANDRVKVIGKITTLAKKCDHSNFTAQTKIRKIVFHGPAH
jgi:hypothetical protein